MGTITDPLTPSSPDSSSPPTSPPAGPSQPLARSPSSQRSGDESKKREAIAVALALDDIPPSYEFATTATTTAGSEAGESSAAAAAGPSRPWPESMDTLFTGPPNAEPMITRERAAAGPKIEVMSKGIQKITIDPALRDPRVLYDFIRRETLQPPSLTVRCFAFRNRTADHSQTVMQNGQPRVVQAGQQYRVTDFDFHIDLTPIYSHPENNANIFLYARPPSEPAHRGTFSLTIGGPTTPEGANKPRSASNSAVSIWKSWGEFCQNRARAPWGNMKDDEEFWATRGDASGSRQLSLSERREDEEALLEGDNAGHDADLRAWCEAFCADPGLLKSFTLRKSVWGWDFVSLRHAIERSILATGYQPSADLPISIQFQVKDDVVVVQDHNWLTRLTQNGFVFFLLIITLVYPMIWLWQRFSQRGGAPYDIARATYAMKFYPPLPSTYPSETVQQAQDRLPGLFKLHPEVPRTPFLHKGPKGVHYLLGAREGTFYREWDERVRMAVRMFFHGELTSTLVRELEPPELDGY